MRQIILLCAVMISVSCMERQPAVRPDTTVQSQAVPGEEKSTGQVLPERSALYIVPDGVETRWASFENQGADKGKGGMENMGAKGHAMDYIPAGGDRILLNIVGSGILRRMWITISDRSPVMLRSLRIDIYWDGESKPAVSAPFGDFFGLGLGRRTPFENEFFSDPEGRSFNCSIPMPFKKAARVVVKNESEKDLDMIFYDIDFTLSENPIPQALYFHCFWNRQEETTLREDFEILPEINGKGRFLGCNIGIIANPLYQGSWWGEGEVKVYLNGDDDFPTLVGTGTEDFIGTAWGQGEFSHRYQGCLVADREKDQWAFYRFHVKDPVYFAEGCRVTIQQIGGNEKAKVIELEQSGVPLVPISIHQAPMFVKLLEMSPVPELTDPSLPDGWTNFYRVDDVSATAYFYIDKPVTSLPALAPVGVRTAGLEDSAND